jgi:hypothetical protein
MCVNARYACKVRRLITKLKGVSIAKAFKGKT